MRGTLFKSFFLIAIVPFLIFMATYGVFYITISAWVDNPARHFGDIKASLDSYGDLTEEERDQIENHSITPSTANKAVAVARPDLLWDCAMVKTADVPMKYIGFVGFVFFSFLNSKFICPLGWNALKGLLVFFFHFG
jgi:hypothetical protein